MGKMSSAVMTTRTAPEQEYRLPAAPVLAVPPVTVIEVDDGKMGLAGLVSALFTNRGGPIAPRRACLHAEVPACEADGHYVPTCTAAALVVAWLSGDMGDEPPCVPARVRIYYTRIRDHKGRSLGYFLHCRVAKHQCGASVRCCKSDGA